MARAAPARTGGGSAPAARRGADRSEEHAQNVSTQRREAVFESGEPEVSGSDSLRRVDDPGRFPCAYSEGERLTSVVAGAGANRNASSDRSSRFRCVLRRCGAGRRSEPAWETDRGWRRTALESSLRHPMKPGSSAFTRRCPQFVREGFAHGNRSPGQSDSRRNDSRKFFEPFAIRLRISGK